MSIPLGTVASMVHAAAMHRLTGRRRPINLMLALTDRCNIRCGYCAIPDRGAPEMALEEVYKILDEGRAMGCRRLGLWGGEPLVYRRLPEVIGHAKRLGMFITVDTNAHLLPKRFDAVADAHHLNISLDGPREAHDRARGAGSFDQVMAGIEAVRGRLPFWTITVLAAHNLDSVDWMLRTAREIGFLTTFQVLHHNDILGDNEELRPDDADLREALRLILARKKEGWPVVSSKRYLRRLIEWPDYRKTILDDRSKLFPCVAGGLYANVDVSGHLYPCSILIDTMDAPNARDEGLPAAFDKLGKAPCDVCLGGCFSEYNFVFNLDPETSWNWFRMMRGTRAASGRAALGPPQHGQPDLHASPRSAETPAGQ